MINPQARPRVAVHFVGPACAGRIMKTLERTIGRDNFHFLVQA
jgi:hypothetical protein